MLGTGQSAKKAMGGLLTLILKDSMFQLHWYIRLEHSFCSYSQVPDPHFIHCELQQSK